MAQPLRLASLTAAAAAGFEQPFEMLQACHERITRTLALLARLRAHLRRHGADTQAQQAARDVLRYFDRAAPEHHRDEELHVFPPVLAQGDAAQHALVARLLRDHRDMEARWAKAREVLAWTTDGSLQRLEPAHEAALDAFAALYAAHLAAEEDLAYPAARALLDAPALRAMGDEMRARRGAHGPPAIAAPLPPGGAAPKTSQP